MTTISFVFFPALSDFKNTVYVVLNYIFKLTVCVYAKMQHIILSTRLFT